jgi:hypothetical protein
MRFTDNFSSVDDSVLIFQQQKVPVFQNKVYPTKEAAMAADFGIVELAQSKTSGFIFNRAFNTKLMNYDINYQNEQSNSQVFKDHLTFVMQLLKSFGIADKKVVEIGCGKGVFFEMMLEEGIDCIGFDPTYEGENPKIIKEYFDQSCNNIHADVIVMRHTLEHIPNPFSFINEIAAANNYTGMLFVEVPTFDWIKNKGAFWDIFYEHCNYFTENSLSSMFNDAKTGNFFGGQYIYLWADLSKLKNTIAKDDFIPQSAFTFKAIIDSYVELLGSGQTFAIWGAGAKGSTFLNLLDPERKYVQYVVDINPAKQGKHIACTGHPIYAPKKLQEQAVDAVIVMNENYIAEIKSIINDLNIKIYTL